MGVVRGLAISKKAVVLFLATPTVRMYAYNNG
jgi:hypothetical protein